MMGVIRQDAIQDFLGFVIFLGFGKTHPAAVLELLTHVVIKIGISSQSRDLCAHKHNMSRRRVPLILTLFISLRASCV